MGAATIQAANWRLATFALIALQLFDYGASSTWRRSPRRSPTSSRSTSSASRPISDPSTRPRCATSSRPRPRCTTTSAAFSSTPREISSDPAVLKRNWLDAYKLVTPNGANQLNAYVHDHNPFEQQQTQVRVSLEVYVIVQITQETWQVDWTETTWDDHGTPTGVAAGEGRSTSFCTSPRTPISSPLNPLGLFIDELHWARLSTPIAAERTTP